MLLRDKKASVIKISFINKYDVREFLFNYLIIHNMKNNKYLFVDLDGSLLKSDLLHESFVNSFSKDFFAPIKCIVVLIKSGITGLKDYLYQNSFIEIKNLPFNQDVLDFIAEWKVKNDGDVILISASHHLYVKNVFEYLKIFNFFYGTLNKNLKSTAKLQTIKEHTQGHAFDYIGNTHDDLIIWQSSSQAITVNASRSVEKKINQLKSNVISIKDNNSFFIRLIKLIRVHQWSKNLLLFLPSILAMSASFNGLVQTFAGFIAFSLTASAFYIFNDLLDIENDREHIKKKYRPLAAGDIQILDSATCFFSMIAASIIISLYLEPTFQLILLLYAILTFTYSKLLKKIPVLDIITLASLYVIRIVGGASITNLDVSNWLFTFSAFFFLFLASVKRWIEIENSSGLSIAHRGYTKKDLNFITHLSYFCGLISVLIICLYIDSQQAALIYTNSQILWFIPIIFLYWIVETLFLVSRSKVDDDPVVYALKSKTSYICAILLTIIFYFAA